MGKDGGEPGPRALLVRMPAQLHERLRRLAYEQHRAMADVARIAIEDFLGRSGQERERSGTGPRPRGTGRRGRPGRAGAVARTSTSGERAVETGRQGPSSASPAGSSMGEELELAGMGLDEFRCAVRDALCDLVPAGSRSHDLWVGDLRRHLPLLPAGEFDRLLLRLAGRYEISLVACDDPASLPPGQRDACVRDPASGRLFAWVRRGL